jgi:hypothetical protein
MRLTRRAIWLCVTALTAMAMLIPVSAAQAAPRPRTPVLHTSASPMAVALTDDQAHAAGLSLTGPTTLRLPTGGHVLVAPGDSGDSTRTTDFRTKRRWFGIVVFFNKNETFTISLGFNACSLVVARVPVLGAALALYCGALSIYANHLQHEHRCLRATVIWGGVAPAWTSHNGRDCR